MLVDRIKNTIFKSYKDASIEYHAGGFFIRKRAQYLIFTDNAVIFYEREEGLHPNDNNYELLLEGLRDKNNLYQTGEVISLGENMLEIRVVNNKHMRLMPSIFIENILRDELSEIILDRRDENITIYTLVKSVVDTSRHLGV